MKLLSSKRFDALFALLSSASFLLLIYFAVGMAFETNDDVFINQILSGTMTGKPDAHAIHINYALGKVLSGLYLLTTKVPWYGIFLVSLLGISYSIIIYSFLSKCNTILSKAEIMVLLWGGVFLTAVYSSSQIQFTTVAAWAAISGYCYFCLHYKNRRAHILFFALELLAFFLRKDAMLMIQPFGFSVFVFLVMFDQSMVRKQKLVEYAKLLSTVLLCFLLGFLFNFIGYNTKEWNEFFAYNGARVTIFDYYASPEYEEVADILDKYSVSETDYIGFQECLNVGSRFPSECAKEIADFAICKADKEDFTQSLLRVIRSLIPEDTLFNITGIYTACGAVLIIVLLVRHYCLLLPLGTAIGSFVIIWGYLTYRGRMPFRVCMPLISGELVFLLVVYVSARVEKTNKGEKKHRLFAYFGICVMIACWFLTSFRVGRWQFNVSSNRCVATRIIQEGYAETIDYCRERSENTYILEARTFAYCTEVFDTTCYGKTNYIISGGWFGYSPNFTEYANKYLGDFTKRFYLIKYDGAAEDDAERWAVSLDYFHNVSKHEPRIVDTIAVKSGAIYNVCEY